MTAGGPARQPAGRPTGGRFTAAPRPEPRLALHPPIEPLSEEELLIARLEEDAELEAIAWEDKHRL